MITTKFRSVKVGDSFYIPDPIKGTNKLNRFIKLSSKEAFGDSKVELKPSSPVYIVGSYFNEAIR